MSGGPQRHTRPCGTCGKDPTPIAMHSANDNGAPRQVVHTPPPMIPPFLAAKNSNKPHSCGARCGELLHKSTRRGKTAESHFPRVVTVHTLTHTGSANPKKIRRLCPHWSGLYCPRVTQGKGRDELSRPRLVWRTRARTSGEAADEPRAQASGDPGDHIDSSRRGQSRASSTPV